MNNSDKSNNIFTFEIVSGMLHNYQEMKRKALQLEFELTILNNLISDSEFIDAMSLSSPKSDGIQGGFASDKTANIAISYSDKLDDIRIKETKELSKEYMSVALLMERIKHYISLLPPKQSFVLHKLYIEGAPFGEFIKAEELSISTIKKYKRLGITQLVDMFNFVADRG